MNNTQSCESPVSKEYHAEKPHTSGFIRKFADTVEIFHVNTGNGGNSSTPRRPLIEIIYIYII